MNLADAERLARALVAEHGLTDWTFRFDGAKRRFGHCSHRLKQISISRHLTALNDEEEVRDVILHEIAHARVGPGIGHGWQWKTEARRIGARPERCYDSVLVETPPAPWLAVCHSCGRQSKRHRRRNDLACGACCKSRNGGKWDARFLLDWIPNPDGPLAIKVLEALGDA